MIHEGIPQLDSMLALKLDQLVADRCIPLMLYLIRELQSGFRPAKTILDID